MGTQPCSTMKDALEENVSRGLGGLRFSEEKSLE